MDTQQFDELFPQPSPSDTGHHDRPTAPEPKCCNCHREMLRLQDMEDLTIGSPTDMHVIRLSELFKIESDRNDSNFHIQHPSLTLPVQVIKIPIPLKQLAYLADIGIVRINKFQIINMLHLCRRKSNGDMFLRHDPNKPYSLGVGYEEEVAYHIRRWHPKL